MSALNRGERRRHRFARALLTRLGRQVIVPWPVLVEVDLMLRARGRADAAIAFAGSLMVGTHRLESPQAADLELALELGERFVDSGADLPDLVVMAMASRSRAQILTWDFRHFSAVVLRRGHHWPLLVAEDELPAP